jgi:hypothetical protein
VTDPSPDPTRPGESAETEVRIRRAPRLGVFVGLGAVLGVLATLILTSAFPDEAKIGFSALFGYFAVIGVPTGMALGAAVGIVLDRVSTRRARTVRVAREVVAEPEAEPEPESEPESEPDAGTGASSK